MVSFTDLFGRLCSIWDVLLALLAKCSHPKTAMKYKRLQILYPPAKDWHWYFKSYGNCWLSAIGFQILALKLVSTLVASIPLLVMYCRWAVEQIFKIWRCFSHHQTMSRKRNVVKMKNYGHITQSFIEKQHIVARFLVMQATLPWALKAHWWHIACLKYFYCTIIFNALQTNQELLLLLLLLLISSNFTCIIIWTCGSNYT